MDGIYKFKNGPIWFNEKRGEIIDRQNSENKADTPARLRYLVRWQDQSTTWMDEHLLTITEIKPDPKKREMAGSAT